MSSTPPRRRWRNYKSDSDDSPRRELRGDDERVGSPLRELRYASPLPRRELRYASPLPRRELRDASPLPRRELREGGPQLRPARYVRRSPTRRDMRGAAGRADRDRQGQSAHESRILRDSVRDQFRVAEGGALRRRLPTPPRAPVARHSRSRSRSQRAAARAAAIDALRRPEGGGSDCVPGPNRAKNRQKKLKKEAKKARMDLLWEYSPERARAERDRAEAEQAANAATHEARLSQWALAGSSWE